MPFTTTITLAKFCIERANYVKDLGVVLDTKLTFDRHAKEVINRFN